MDLGDTAPEPASADNVNAKGEWEGSVPETLPPTADELNYLTADVTGTESTFDPPEPISKWTMEEIEARIKEADLNNPPEQVGLHQLPRQRREIVAKKGGTFTMIVAGASGLGKTTFINTLFGTSLLPKSEVEGPSRADKTTKIRIHRTELEEQGFKLSFTVIDTPGFGDYINNSHAWVPIMDYIDEQLRLYLFQEEQPDRSQKVDSRIHCCLYFISPTGHALSPLDICAMKELGKRANLIPVLAKSDAFSKEEMSSFKSAVRATLKAQGITLCDLLANGELSPQVQSLMPFSVIGAESIVAREDGVMVRGRKYGWGVAEVENPNHCDFVELRKILMGNHMLDLILSTEKFYEHYRRHLLKFRLKCASKKNEKDDTPVAETKGNDGLSATSRESQLPLGGIECLKALTNFKLDQLEKELMDSSPIFLEKQVQMRKRFSDIVNGQEYKFKEWKSALFERQKNFNADIETTHNRVLQLTEEIRRLEDNEESVPKKGSVRDVSETLAPASAIESAVESVV